VAAEARENGPIAPCHEAGSLLFAGAAWMRVHEFGFTQGFFISPEQNPIRCLTSMFSTDSSLIINGKRQMPPHHDYISIGGGELTIENPDLIWKL